MRKSKNFFNTNVQFTLSETVMLSKQSVTLKEMVYFKGKKKSDTLYVVKNSENNMKDNCYMNK